eukprot:166771-Pelagomonas_calceolata.AAC.1
MHTQLEAPLLRAVLRRGQQCNDVPFHVPGHKQAEGMDTSRQDLVYSANRASSNFWTCWQLQLKAFPTLSYMHEGQCRSVP